MRSLWPWPLTWHWPSPWPWFMPHSWCITITFGVTFNLTLTLTLTFDFDVDLDSCHIRDALPSPLVWPSTWPWALTLTLTLIHPTLVHSVTWCLLVLSWVLSSSSRLYLDFSMFVIFLRHVRLLCKFSRITLNRFIFRQILYCCCIANCRISLPN